MIRVDIKPRQDDLYDMYIGDEGDHFVNSSQGYANVEDVEAIARRLWPPLPAFYDVHVKPWGIDVRMPAELVVAGVSEPVVMVVTYRDGKTKTEHLR